MPLLDQSLIWESLERRLARTANPRHRAMLECVIKHGRAEAEGDFAAVLATLDANPAYHFWSEGRDVGPKGMTAVVEFYKVLLGTGCSYLESPKDRVVVDDDNVVTEMRVRQILPGRAARANGYEIDDEEAFYLISFRAVILWPFSQAGKLIGEDSYVSRNMADIRKLSDGEVPDKLRELVSGSAPNASYVFT